ncbi:MAG TPA: ABC transporter permease [Candidatus Paceibacterota bacterium]|nr:ABC transporter permease [Candidatus Paceibacterota bacterium]
MNNTYLKQAIRGIKSSPSRTILTTLGIVIGIGTVILVLSLGEGFKSYINSQVDAFGSNTVFVETSVPASTKDRSSANASSQPNSSANNAVPITTLKNRDIADIKNLPNVVNAYGAVLSQQIATYGNVSKNVFIFGADASRFDIDKGVISSGRGYTEEEDRSLAQVAVLGHDIAIDLFGEDDPLGKFVRLGNYNFEIIGVYDRRGSFGFSNDDEQIFIPVDTLQKKILGIDYLFYAVVQLQDNSKADITSLDIADVLRQNHYIANPSRDDFKVSTQTESLDTFNTILQAVTFLLIAIASISLVVGGVGVMNIMYVVVTERVGEIGLKKALGARNNDILYEFLIEAVLLTIIGGVIGILGGSLLSFIASKVAQNFGLKWDFIVPLWGIFLSVSVSMIIGIVFGVFPARNASKLNPIEALNKE